MSKLPQQAREAFDVARLEFEPGAARLQRLREKLDVLTQSAAQVPSAYDVPPPRVKTLSSFWRWSLPLWGGAAVWLLLSSQDAPSNEQRSQPAPVPAAQLSVPHQHEPQVRAEAETTANSQGVEPAQSEERKSLAAQPELPPNNPRLVASRSRIANVRAARARTQAAPPIQVPQAEVPVLPAEKNVPPLVTASIERVGQNQRSSTPQSQLSSELTLIVGARSALRRGDHASAKRLLMEHQTSFPSGQLLAERLSLLVRLQCTLDDVKHARESFEALRKLRLSGLEQAARESCGGKLP